MPSNDPFMDSDSVQDEEEEESLGDADTCSSEEIQRAFFKKLNQLDQRAVALNNEYVTHLCADESFNLVVAGVSDMSLRVFDFKVQHGLTSIEAPVCTSFHKEAMICGVRFMDDSFNNLLVGTTDGLIRLFDLRSKSEVTQFKNTLECKLLSVDRNANSRIICGGSNKVASGSYLIFYDVRKNEEMGVYSDSHSDEVTTLSFHPTNPDFLCSGSLDGLVNVFNIQEEDEDDALLETFNIDNALQKVKWHLNIGQKNIISCITMSNDLVLYDSEEADEIASFNRENITSSIFRTCASNCNVVNTHTTSDSKIMLLAGTYQEQGNILRSVVYDNEKLLPYTNFEKNTQIVRDSLYNAKDETLIAAGEGGIVSVWSCNSNNSDLSEPIHSSLKITTKHKHKKNPY